ncbi:MAG: outer membrane protein assembly factor BamD [Myxococcota bacterium]
MTEPRRWSDPESPESARVKHLLTELDAAPPPGAQARVWRAMGTPKAAARSRAWLLVGAPALAAVAFALFPRADRPEASLVLTRGEVAIEGSASAAPTPGQALPAGASIKTRHDGRATFNLAKAAIAVAPLSEAELVSTPSGLSIALVTGSVEITVPRDAERALSILGGAFRVELPREAEAEIVRDSSDHLLVRVHAGEVSVMTPNGSTTVRGQESRRFGPPEPTAAQEAPSPSPSPAEPELAAAESAPSEAPAPLAESVPTPRAIHRKNKAPRPAMTKAETPAAPAPLVQAPPAPAPAPTPAPVVSVTPDIPPSASPRAAPAAPAFDEDAVYHAARSANDRERAIALFDEVRAHHGALAEIASGQAAMLMMRAERYADAAARYETMLRSFPTGTLAQEARLGLIECHIRLSDLPRAQRELERFLADFPASERSSDLRFVRAEIARRSDRCGEAIPDYRAASNGNNADDAGYFMAWCLLKSSASDGRLALERYLQAFPRGKHAAAARDRLSKKD